MKIVLGMIARTHDELAKLRAPEYLSKARALAERVAENVVMRTVWGASKNVSCLNIELEGTNECAQ